MDTVYHHIIPLGWDSERLQDLVAEFSYTCLSKLDTERYEGGLSSFLVVINDTRPKRQDGGPKTNV
jgi:hypothetical protein